MKRPGVILYAAAFMPVVAVLAAYQLNIHAGDALEPRFVCNPYWDGCVSISRAARSGPGLHLFRALMMPCAVLLFFGWYFVREWLAALDAASSRSARAVFVLGAAGAAFLVVYVAWLGTEGDLYRWLRRYGVIFYFAGTGMAQLLLLRLLWPIRKTLAGGRLRGSILVLTAMVSMQWAMGLLSLAKALFLDDPDLVDRIENVIEWLFALPMTLAFVPIAMMLGRTGFRIRFVLNE
ncbi:MAG: hypothetical protein V2I79_08460 [Xanthomonadales bacterium]|nr:hypothetical protein [Xanthomonadales bacterium]